MIAITTLFNPSQRRLKNYDLFRSSLPLPLITVELSYDGVFFIEDSIKIISKSILWHKEDLLNIGISECNHNKLVCLDCDLANLDERWVKDLETALDQHNVVQPFSAVYNLDQDGNVLFSQRSIASSQDSFDLLTQRKSGAPTAGYTWAFRKDFIAKYGLYDRCIVGGGDTALACAVLGKYDTVMDLHFMNPQQRETYLNWATGINKDASVGSVNKEIVHMWHGSFESRKSSERHKGLQPFAYDPNTDVTLTPEGVFAGVLEWSSDKQGLHGYVKSYLADRAGAESPHI